MPSDVLNFFYKALKSTLDYLFLKIQCSTYKSLKCDHFFIIFFAYIILLKNDIKFSKNTYSFSVLRFYVTALLFNFTLRMRLMPNQNRVNCNKVSILILVYLNLLPTSP